MSRKANLSAARRRAADAPPSMAALRARIMAGDFQAKPVAAKAPVALPYGVPALPHVLPAAAEAERARITALAGIAEQAGRMGLAFDLTAAINSGQAVSLARRAVLDQAADRDDSVGEIYTAALQDPNGRSGHGGLSDAAKRAAFRRGLTGTR